MSASFRLVVDVDDVGKIEIECPGVSLDDGRALVALAVEILNRQNTPPPHAVQEHRP